MAVAPPTIDVRVLGFSIALASITGILFGLWPALGAARRSSANDVSSRRGSSYAATSRDGRALRSIFVVSEMAFALMLLIGAGLMLRSFRALMQTDSGVEVNRVASMQLALSNSRYPNSQALNSFYGTLLERLRRAPGITDAAVVSVMPLQGEFGIGLAIDVEGRDSVDPERMVYPQYLRATPDYFRVMGIRMIAGRAMSESDKSNAPVVVINQALADTLWPGGNAIGKRFSLGVMPGDKPSYMTVVGVVANVRSRSLDLAPTPQMYLPFNDGPTSASAVIVRGSANAATLLTGLRSSMRAVDAEQPVYDLQMLEDAVSKTVAPRRTNTLLIALFGLLSVTLAAFGVYAVIGYGVAQRTREIGIRIALGAQVQSVVVMVVREGLMLGLCGIAIGLAGAWVLSRILESLLYGVSTRDPFTFVVAPMVLIGITIAATLIPARAASRVDPVKAIRME